MQFASREDFVSIVAVESCQQSEEISILRLVFPSIGPKRSRPKRNKAESLRSGCFHTDRHFSGSNANPSPQRESEDGTELCSHGLVTVRMLPAGPPMRVLDLLLRRCLRRQEQMRGVSSFVSSGLRRQLRHLG